MSSGITWRERLQNLADDWGGKRKEIRHTAVGWQPDAGYQEDTNCPTPSGEREFYRVIRPGPKPKDTKGK
jgi:hypothetical protein